MKAKPQGGKKTKAHPAATVRALIGFPSNVYERSKTSRGKKVSLAWDVREASENYTAEERPLFVKPRQ